MKCSKCGAENLEGFKFCDACGSPLGQSQISTREAGHTKLVKLNCPSCCGALELPDSLTIAHCLYCGTKILLDQDGVVHERRDFQRYVELCKVAVEAKNHKEAIDVCNKILEIDPKNVEAWINKAVSTFWLTTGANNRYDEAMEYLTKASQIAPSDDRIDKVRKELTNQQALWYNLLGNQSWEMAQKMYNIKYEFYTRMTYFTPGRNAKDDTAEDAVKAMNYYLTASDYDPDNIIILINIANCARFYDTLVWSKRVHAKIKKQEMLLAKKAAETTLPKRKAALEEAQAELAKLRTQGGMFAGMKINDVEQRIKNLKSDIARMEKAIAYDPLDDK